jgi:carboxymethylenebutenolidase
MDDETLPFEKTRDYALSRRGFAALSLGTVASVPPWPQTQSPSDVVLRMADGSCDAALFHPIGDGRWPGIVIFADALGLRPVFSDMGRRLAAEGYTVIVPSPFYRTRKTPVLSDRSISVSRKTAPSSLSWWLH